MEPKAVCEGLPGLDAVGWLPGEVVVYYGSFSTLLAGFCISGLLWTSSRDRGKVHAESLIGLWSSVLPLATAALLYFEMSGELDCRRAAFDLMTPSITLSIGAVVLFLYMGELISDVLREPGGADGQQSIDSAVLFSLLIRWVVVVIASASLVSLNAIVLRLVEGNMWFVTVQAAAVVATLAFAIRSRQPAPRPKMKWIDLSSTEHLRPMAVVCFCVIAYVASFSVTFGIEHRSAGWFEGMSSARTVLWCLFLIAMLGWRRPVGAGASGGRTSPSSA